MLWVFSSAVFAADIQPYLTNAAIAIARLEFERAYEIYSSGLEQQPGLKERAELLRFRALASELAANPDRAEADYDAFVQLAGDLDPDAYRLRGRFYFNRDRLDLALADYGAGAARFPDNGEFPNGQGLVLSNQGKFDEAVSRFDEAIRLNPASAEFVMGRAEAYDRSAQPMRALEDYDKALVLGKLSQRDMARLRTGRGHANFQLRQYGTAIEDLNAALELSPDMVNALKLRGLCFEREAKLDLASRDYQSVLKLAPADEWAAKRVQVLRGK
jgi:tetratricopeptide (TPR) repeat protein